MLNRWRKTYHEYPPAFWVLMLGTFIDGLGGFLLFPFFSLYITRHFNVGLTEAGILFAIFSITSTIGSFLGGALTDKFGRKSMFLFGLVTSALSSLLMGLVNDLQIFYILAGFVGLLANTGGPAQTAMIADLLPEDKQAEGYAMHRVVFNLSAAIGPAIGGILASFNFLYLFIIDAITSLITATIVLAVIPETKPAATEESPDESLAQTMAGYTRVLRDGVFMAYAGISVLGTIVYVQMNATLPVYLRDIVGIPPEGYGFLLSLNATMVVFLQFWITRRLSRFAPMYMMALGAFLYAVGFGMHAFGSTLFYFSIAMVVITVGEMVLAPVGQALVARFAPIDMRGRYMAIFGFTWGISFAVGPLMAGVLMDNYEPNWVWYGSFILGMLTTLGYLAMHRAVQGRFSAKDVGEAPPPAASPI